MRPTSASSFAQRRLPTAARFAVRMCPCACVTAPNSSLAGGPASFPAQLDTPAAQGFSFSAFSIISAFFCLTSITNDKSSYQVFPCSN